MQSQTYQEPTFMIVISTFARCVAIRRCGTAHTTGAGLATATEMTHRMLPVDTKFSQFSQHTTVVCSHCCERG